MTRRPPTRPGFTLLEVLLASAISVVLLGGLYVAFDLALVRNDIAREQVARADLIRAVVNRLAADLSTPISPLPPKSGGGSSSTTASVTTTTETTESTTTTTTDAGTGTSTSNTTSTTTTTTSDESIDAAEIVNLPFQSGVIGSNTHVTLFASRVPTGMLDPLWMAVPDAGLPADLRKVTYYLGSAGGLCRQERLWVLSDEVGSTGEPDPSTEDLDLIAPEVTAATFEYFDGADWLPEWDGTQPGPDGSPVGGPPRAIRATLTFEFPETGQVATKQVIQVFPVRAANGLFYTPAESTTDEGGM